MKHFLLAIAIVFSISFFTSCSKGTSAPAPANTPAPTVTSLSANEGDYNSAIVITGSNFNSSVSGNQVFFNGVQATITAASSTQLTVSVPKNAGNGTVTVKVGTTTASGPSFTYLGVLTVNSLSANQGTYLTNINITGTGFSLTANNNQVFFNNVPASVTAATSTQLTVQVPLSAGTGNVSVSVDKGNSIQGPSFTYQVSYFVTTIAGNNQSGEVNGTGSSAFFSIATGICSDATGNVYVVYDGGLVRKVTPAGVVTSYVGQSLNNSSNIGSLSSANLGQLNAVTIDAFGNMYIADQSNNIWKITTTGTVSKFVTGTKLTRFDGLTTDATGNVYVADSFNDVILKISPAGAVTTLAGSGQPGSSNGNGTAAYFNAPTGVAVDAAGNVYVADYNNNVIRKITSAGIVTNFCAANFIHPQSLTIDATGNIYVADTGEGLVKKVTPMGDISTIAGTPGTGGTNTVDGPGTTAVIYGPTGITIDSQNNLYITDANTVRRISFK